MRRKGKVWYFEFMYKGKRYYERIGAVSKTLAKEIANEVKARIIRGEYVPHKRDILFKEAVQNYLIWYESNSNAREKSKKKHRSRIRKLLDFFGNYRLSEIDMTLIEKYKLERLKKVKKETVNKELTVLSSIFRRAKEMGIYEKDIPKIKKFKVEEKENIRFLSFEEAKKLIDACPKWFKPVIVFALNTGLRAGEIFSLKWENVDFENRVIYVPSSYSKTKKTYKVFMNDVVYRLLKDLEKEKKEHGFVFTNSFGLPYKYEDGTYLKVFKSACKKAGIKNLRFHDLRHTFASWVAIKSKDIYVVQRLLNHSDLRMTKRYAHLTENYLRDVVNSISNFGSISEKEEAVIIKHTNGV